MSKKPPEGTKTTEFEVEGIEEAYAPARKETVVKPGEPFRGPSLPRLQVDRPPELNVEHEARIWILERRTRGWIAQLKRWLFGKTWK